MGSKKEVGWELLLKKSLYIVQYHCYFILTLIHWYKKIKEVRSFLVLTHDKDSAHGKDITEYISICHVHTKTALTLSEEKEVSLTQVTGNNIFCIFKVNSSITL